jgi:hypothetical protein
MVRSDAAAAALGCLTVVQHEKHGYFGGYLLLNARGRPLEFHCTAPVKPNRAQEILYGATLPAYLFGEVIGQTLIQQATRLAPVICTDRVELLALSDLIDQPVVAIDDQADSSIPAEDFPGGSSACRLTVGHHRLSMPARHAAAVADVRTALEPLLERIDLNEPFDRIREALNEAQRGSQ